jgi:uncharacterized protein
VTKTLQLVVLLALLALISVLAIGAFSGAETPWQPPAASPQFPFDKAATLQTVIAVSLSRPDLQVAVNKTAIQQEALTWTMYAYTVHLSRRELYSEVVYSLSEVIYANGGKIFQTYFTGDEPQASLTVGIESFITHTITLTWDAAVADLTPTPAAAREENVGLRAAIVIDDLGASLYPVRQLLDLEEDLTFSVLPQLQKSLETATLLHEHDKEILLHLPMEPLEYAYPGKGAILMNMDVDAIQRTIEENLQTVPYAAGVNNHMGSRLTSSAEKMQAVLQTLQQHQLFFLDSRTTGGSIAYAAARQLGLKSAERRIFLDYEPGYTYAKNQLLALATLAEQGKPAIAIGHPKEATLQALKDVLPEFKRRAIQIVRLSKLVE